MNVKERTGLQVDQSGRGDENQVVTFSSKLEPFFSMVRQNGLPNIVGQISNDDLIRYFKVSSEYLFIAEDYWDEFLKKYAAWLAKESGKSFEVISGRIKSIVYGNAPVVVKYIFEGSTPQPVVAVRHNLINPRLLQLQLYNGDPLLADNYIHKKDPLLTRLSCLKNYDGNNFELQWRKDQSLTVSGAVLAKLRDFLVDCLVLASDYPQILISNRELLKRIVDILPLIRPAKSNLPLFVRLEDLKHKNRHYLMLGKAIMAVDDNIVVDVFSSRGRFWKSFCHLEHKSLLEKPPAKPRMKEEGRVLRIVKESVGSLSILAKVDTFFKPVLISDRIINEYVGVVLSTTTDHTLPSRFTLLHLLVDLRDRITKGVGVREIDIPDKKLIEQSKKGDWFIKSGKWYFGFDSRGVLVKLFTQERKNITHRKRK
jgi:hypothetical protein